MKVALLDDDVQQSADMVRMLKSIQLYEHTLVFESFTSGERLRTALRRDTYDLLILSWNMPDLPGIELLLWLRNFQKSETPVMMLSSLLSEGDVVVALGSGADDYAITPVRPPEFCARVSRLLRRAGQNTYRNRVAFGNWTFDRAKTSVSVKTDTAEHLVILTGREFRLALALFEHLGCALSRSHLLEYSGVSAQESNSRALDSHIYRLRGKLLLEGVHGMRLITVYGYGYRLERIS